MPMIASIESLPVTFMQKERPLVELHSRLVVILLKLLIGVNGRLVGNTTTMEVKRSLARSLPS